MAAWIRPWPKDRASRRNYVDQVFREVAPKYDRLTRLLSFGQDDRWKSTLVGLLPDGSTNARVLDLATGTAAFPLLLRAGGHRGAIVGVDRSREMLRRAVGKCAGTPNVRFVEGDLNTLPFAPASFDVVIIGYGLNGQNLARVLRETGLRYCILELNAESVREAAAAGEPIQFGDATRPSVLRAMNAEAAAVIVVAISDPVATRRIVALARALSARPALIVRTRYVS
jgi:ubiquinone/menaquinone biosynthesis C-methylase UbiE